VIGEVVDGYEILRPLGAGGMGEVYLGRDAGGNLRAFKIVRADRQTSPQAASRFRREVFALSKLEHRGIVRILDAGAIDSGVLYLGMEYVAGPDLQAAVGWDGPFPISDALAVVIQLAAALAYAHGAGVIHRDLKPGNVILEEGDARRAKIIDFGLAKIVQNEGLTRLTEDKQALGSPLYWAPEQSTNTDVGPAADIYSLGGIAYFLLSGEPLFKSRPAVAMVYAHTHEQPARLAERCKVELPPGLDDLIARCVAKLPSQRPSAGDIVIALDAMLATLPSTIGQRRAAQHLFTSTGLSNMGDALTNQMRQVLLDLAAVLERPTDDIDRIQHELSELEIDYAVLEADVEGAMLGSHPLDPEKSAHRDAMAAQMAQLKNALGDAYRGLFDAVNADRNRAVPDAHALFIELDTLVVQFKAL
jgi:serine/threonine protein kinase